MPVSLRASLFVSLTLGVSGFWWPNIGSLSGEGRVSVSPGPQCTGQDAQHPTSSDFPGSAAPSPTSHTRKNWLPSKSCREQVQQSRASPPHPSADSPRGAWATRLGQKPPNQTWGGEHGRGCHFYFLSKSWAAPSLPPSLPEWGRG